MPDPEFTKEELDQARQLLIARDKSVFKNRVLIFVTLLSVLAMILLFFRYTEAEAERDAQVENLGKCLVEQLAEHREANRAAHQAFAAKIGAPYTVHHDELPPPVPEDLKKFCAEFVRVP